MSISHLNALEQKLRHKKFDIKMKSNEDIHYGYLWEVNYPQKTDQIMIYFETLSEDGVLSIDESYGCIALHKDKKIGSLYFGKFTGNKWKNDLEKFVTTIGLALSK